MRVIFFLFLKSNVGFGFAVFFVISFVKYRIPVRRLTFCCLVQVMKIAIPVFTIHSLPKQFLNCEWILFKNINPVQSKRKVVFEVLFVDSNMNISVIKQ